jgi:hypothetical protein
VVRYRAATEVKLATLDWVRVVERYHEWVELVLIGDPEKSVAVESPEAAREGGRGFA